MAAILGISAYYHDSAAALVVDGEIVAAAQEERFTRKKHDESFPAHAVASCLEIAGLSLRDVDLVAFYEKPLLKFDRLLETYLGHAPRGFLSFREAMPVWLRTKLHLPREMRKALGPDYSRRFVFPRHHESHAASAFFPSPFEEAAILTLDGVGEWSTASFGVGRGNRIELTQQLRFPHSLGLLYSAFTSFCGFRVNSGEYKLMGLAPYGEPTYSDLIQKHLIDLKPDGSFRMDDRYFRYSHGLTMTSARFHRLFGGEPRKPESPLTRREMDIAASIQSVTEEILLRMGRHIHEQTRCENLCLAGGVALNCVANGRLLREGPFSDIWIQPASGDAGGALGAALYVHHQLLKNQREINPNDRMNGTLLGPGFSDGEIGRFFEAEGVDVEPLESDDALCEAVAGLIAEGKVVGWFQGRMEFGPRALGARSLLGDPRSPQMQSIMNLKIKFRESFRPFAPAILRERASEYFDLPEGTESPYMLLVASVHPDQRLPEDDRSNRLEGIDRLMAPRSLIPAVTHVDLSARVQTVDDGRNPLFAKLLRAFEGQTGCPLVINTSFNVRGEPIVGTPADAYRCFLATDVDALAIGRFLVTKEQARGYAPEQVAAHLGQFRLD